MGTLMKEKFTEPEEDALIIGEDLNAKTDDKRLTYNANGEKRKRDSRDLKINKEGVKLSEDLQR